MVITLVKHGKPDYNGKRQLHHNELAGELDKYNGIFFDRNHRIPCASEKIEPLCSLVDDQWHRFSTCKCLPGGKSHQQLAAGNAFVEFSHAHR